MYIDAISSTTIAYSAIIPSTAGDRSTEPEEESTVVPQSDEPGDQVIGEETETEKIATNDSQKVKGVIRNLMNGHYKGVADVRLRINFNDEIVAMEQAEKDRIAAEMTPGLLESVNSEIDSLLQSEELDEQTIAAITNAQEIFNTSIPQGIDGLTTGLQSGFDDFVTSLNSAFAAPQESTFEEPVETTTPVEDPVNMVEKAMAAVEDEIPAPEETSSFDYEQFITGLIETFTAKLAELESALMDVKVLPELSEPSGKGVAYQKFLDAYNELRGNAEPTAQPESIDALT